MLPPICEREVKKTLIPNNFRVSQNFIFLLHISGTSKQASERAGIPSGAFSNEYRQLTNSGSRPRKPRSLQRKDAWKMRRSNHHVRTIVVALLGEVW